MYVRFLQRVEVYKFSSIHIRVSVFFLFVMNSLDIINLYSNIKKTSYKIVQILMISSAYNNFNQSSLFQQFIHLYVANSFLIHVIAVLTSA